MLHVFSPSYLMLSGNEVDGMHQMWGSCRPGRMCLILVPSKEVSRLANSESQVEERKELQIIHISSNVQSAELALVANEKQTLFEQLEPGHPPGHVEVIHTLNLSNYRLSGLRRKLV